MQNNLSFGYVSGLPGEERERLEKLAEVYNYHLSKNALKNRYYEGRIPLPAQGRHALHEHREHP